MSQSLLVAHYGCHGLEFLSECTVTGAYRYSSSTPYEQAFQIGDDADLMANLELGAVELAADMGSARSRSVRVTGSVQLLERACEGTDRESCVVIGMGYANGVDVPRDAPKARHFFQRACDAGSTPACAAVKMQKL